MRVAQTLLTLLFVIGCDVSARHLQLSGTQYLKSLTEDKSFREGLGSLAVHNTIHVLQVTSSSLQDAQLWIQQLTGHDMTNYLLVTLDAAAHDWSQQHPGHAQTIGTFLKLYDPIISFDADHAASSTLPCTRPLIISVLLAGGFDVVWTDPGTVSRRRLSSAVPSVQPPVQGKPPQTTQLPERHSKRTTNSTCTCLMKVPASNSKAIVASLMHDWHDKCLPAPGIQAMVSHPHRQIQSVVTHCHRPEFDLPYYRLPVSVSDDGPLRVPGLDAESWWCPRCSALCQLCSAL